MNSRKPHGSVRRIVPVLVACVGFTAELAAQSSSVGISSVRAQRFENEDLLFFEPEANDRFALALATGDFNGDGADDLATGMPFDDGLAGFGPVDSGSVVIRYGIVNEGLETGLADQLLSQQEGGSPDPADEDDKFGWALAACDINGDGFDDLAVGIPEEDHLGEEDAGAIQIYYGSAQGISTGGIVFYTQSTDGIPDNVEDADVFGRALACGDFDADGFADLAVGAPLESFGTVSPETAAGIVTFIPGSAVGARPDLATALHQNSAGMDGSAESADKFGEEIAVADFNADGFDDVAVGVPGESQNDVSAGAVQLLFGGSTGIVATGNFLCFESALGGTAEEDDLFGFDMAVGDFDGDGFDDLAIGVPGEDLGALADTGNVGVIYGAASGIAFARSQGFDQDAIHGVGHTESGDRFGTALASGDFDGDGRDDLAIGHPSEHVTGSLDGAVTLLMGAPGVGLSPARRRLLISGTQGIPGNAGEHLKEFGRTLAAGDFDGDGHADLAIGIPFDNEGGLTDVGAEVVLYGALFADGFETATGGFWSASSALD